MLQREKIQSLYIETETETACPITLEDLRKLPGFEQRSWLPGRGAGNQRS
jgi:hypothetical protein